MGHARPETITLRITVIAGQRAADDYAVMWRGMSVGRILLGNGAPHDRPQWTWSCHVHGRPQGSDDRGTGADIDDCKAEIQEGMGADSREPDRSGYRRRATDRGDQRRSARAV